MTNNISPMLHHAIESFEHGIFHYLDGTELGRKFSLLHIDHAIELMIKEKLVRLGKSIYRNDGKTLSIHEAFNSIEKEIQLPERPRLEDFHDIRNTIQHKGLALDELAAEFYVTEGYKFFKRFMNDEFGLSVKDLIPLPFYKAMEGLPFAPEKMPDDAKSLLQEAENLYLFGSYEAAVISAYVSLEITLEERSLKGVIKEAFLNSLDSSSPMLTVKYLEKTGKLSKDIVSKFNEIVELRNKSVHTASFISKEQARKALDSLHEIINAFFSFSSKTTE